MNVEGVESRCDSHEQRSLCKVKAGAYPAQMGENMISTECNITHLRPKPNAIVKGSLTEGSILPFLINLSGLKAFGSGYVSGSCSMALGRFYSRTYHDCHITHQAFFTIIQQS